MVVSHTVFRLGTFCSSVSKSPMNLLNNSFAWLAGSPFFFPLSPVPAQILSSSRGIRINSDTENVSINRSSTLTGSAMDRRTSLGIKAKPGIAPGVLSNSRLQYDSISLERSDVTQETKSY
jgi:hypothetical protein